MCVIAPFGPESATEQKVAARPRLWNFDLHDLRDMIGDKPGFEVASFRTSSDSSMGEPQGWWVATYTADHRPVRPIDLDRHLWLQRPRQTLSATVIAGPDSEETIHWMLRSVCKVADEIIVVDCGMSEECRRIVGLYDVRRLNGIDPRKEGFDRARNLALNNCRCDWCIWLDTNEKLVGAAELNAYLRENVYQAYHIRQHNFATEGTVAALPVRLFRRRPYRGRSVRFWGAVHEHPELDLNEGAGPTVVLGDAHIAHVGYLAPTALQGRFHRNLQLRLLDESRYPNRLIQKHLIMRDDIELARSLLQRKGGRMDEEISAKCHEIIRLYRTYFLGKPQPANCDSLGLYSDALRMLGDGFEVSFQLAVDKVSAHSTRVLRARFGTVDDLLAELRGRAIEQARPFDSDCW